MVLLRKFEYDDFILNELTVYDAVSLSALICQPELYSFIDGMPSSRSEALARVHRWVAGPLDPNIKWINVVIRHSSCDEVVGLCQATLVNLLSDSNSLECELAYIVHPQWQRCGLGKLMMAQFLSEYVFPLRPHSLVASIAPGHVASEKLAASLGLTPTGVVYPNGEVRWSRSRPRHL